VIFSKTDKQNGFVLKRQVFLPFYFLLFVACLPKRNPFLNPLFGYPEIY